MYRGIAVAAISAILHSMHCQELQAPRKPRTSRCPLLAACVLCVTAVFFSSQAIAAPKQTPSESSGAAPRPAAPKVVDSYTITQRGDQYRITISYPHIGNAVADAELAIWAREQASTFAKSVQMAPVATVLPYELMITYETISASSKVVSVVFFISTSIGGAHPEPGLATFVYEKSNGRRLSYADIFLTPTNLLETLSEICRASLTQSLGSRLVPDMLTAGTTPEWPNFDLFALTRDGLRIYFPPYQAAPYSEGYLTVGIPLGHLQAFSPQKTLWDKE